MIGLLRSIGRFLEEGGYPVTLSLVLACAAIWVLFLERLRVFGDSPWALLAPSFNRKRIAHRNAFTTAFAAYCQEPTASYKETLDATCELWRTPVSLFARRILVTAAPGPRGCREALLDATERLGRKEVWRGIEVIRWLIHASIFLGIVAAVGSLADTLGAMSSLGIHLETVWSEGVSRALLGAELALIVALPASIASVWLSRRAGAIEKEIHCWHDRLRVEPLDAWEGKP